MQKFAKILENYRQSLTRLVGKDVQWIAKVTDISKQGVRIECHEFGKIDPTSTSTRAATYGVTVYVNVEPGHFEKYGHYNHVKEETLLLEKQIALDFAKTLRNSDKILIKGQIAGVFVSTYARDGRISTPDYAEIFVENAVGVPLR